MLLYSKKLILKNYIFSNFMAKIHDESGAFFIFMQQMVI